MKRASFGIAFGATVGYYAGKIVLAAAAELLRLGSRAAAVRGI